MNAGGQGSSMGDNSQGPPMGVNAQGSQLENQSDMFDEMGPRCVFANVTNPSGWEDLTHGQVFTHPSAVAHHVTASLLTLATLNMISLLFYLHV